MSQSQMPDERDLFLRLGDDAQRAHLPEPEALRRRSDRRTTTRVALGTLAVVVAVVGVLAGANGLTGTAAPEQDPANTGPASPTASETIDSSPLPEAIPATAWLDKGDLGFESDPARRVDVPAPCGNSLVPHQWIESGDVLSSGSRAGNYHSAGTPTINTPDGTITQTLVLMPDEQAADGLMFSVQEWIAGCPQDTKADSSDVTYRLVDPALVTPDAQPDREMLIEVSTSYESVLGSPPDVGADRFRTFVSVLRVGDAVTFLELRGWEASDTDLADVQRLERLATVRLRAWRD